jgi:hypothetical protein
LAVATVRLWRAAESHGQHMADSAHATKQTAKVMARQTDAFIAAESPTLVFSGFKLVERSDEFGRPGAQDPISSVPFPEFLQALVWPINIGRSPLRIIRVCMPPRCFRWVG